MFNKNEDNKLGINDVKIGKNDNVDKGDNKNNKDQEKNIIKNSQLTNSNNTQNFENNQSINNAETINNYYSTKAKEDSKYELLLKVIDLKVEANEKLANIGKQFTGCEECINIHKKGKKDMMEKWVKQFATVDEGGVITTETISHSIVPYTQLQILPFDTALNQTNNFFAQQKHYIEQYKKFRPQYFIPCKEHHYLQLQHANLINKIEDYDKILNNLK